MGATGLLLVGFLLEHLHGNLKLTPLPMIGDAEGREFDAYVELIAGFGVFKYVAEFLLLLLFACHIVIALQLTLENREARARGYTIRNHHGAKTIGSASMHLTGAIVLVYLIKHLLDFRFNSDFHESPAATVAEVLAHPLNALIYIAVSIVIGIHISHGFRSSFQSMGVPRGRWNQALVTAGFGLSLLVTLGFAWIPIYFFFFHN